MRKIQLPIFVFDPDRRSQDVGHVVRRVEISKAFVSWLRKTHPYWFHRDQTGSEERMRTKLFCSTL